MVETTRIEVLQEGDADPKARYVLYWMQASQREAHNPALEHAIELANARDLPTLVCFGLMDDYPEANERHYAFMLEGLKDVGDRLAKRGIKFVCRHGQPFDAAIHFGKHAAAVVCDRGYLRHQKLWRQKVVDGLPGKLVVQVEADTVVPVEVTSNKHEFAARTIRPKIHREWAKYIAPLPPGKVKRPSLALDVKGDTDVSDPAALLKKLKLDRSVKPSGTYKGGQTEAQRRLKAFLQRGLPGYDEGRNEPANDGTSHMSMYLHFGMISPVELALAARDSSAPKPDREAYLEELIVRRELSLNFCNFNPKYDRYDCLPDWAKKTLAEHAGDERPVVYGRDDLEAGKTYDPYWNAAQLEMVRTGFMHNYMRMYWGKKILEWTKSPQEAFEITLYLNNKYFLCGRDPNAYANVAWVFGLHDRPWTERKIFGKIRYMNAAGLERKFDIDGYVKRVALLG